MKHQNDFIFAGAFLFVAIVAGAIFGLKAREPDTVPTAPTVVTTDAQIPRASVVKANSLPGGSDDSGLIGGGGGSIGIVDDSDFEGPGVSSPSFSGGSGTTGGRPSIGVGQ